MQPKLRDQMRRIFADPKQYVNKSLTTFPRAELTPSRRRRHWLALYCRPVCHPCGIVGSHDESNASPPSPILMARRDITAVGGITSARTRHVTHPGAVTDVTSAAGSIQQPSDSHSISRLSRCHGAPKPSDLRWHIASATRSTAPRNATCPRLISGAPRQLMIAGAGCRRGHIADPAGQLQPQIVNWHSDMRKVHLFLPKHDAVT